MKKLAFFLAIIISVPFLASYYLHDTDYCYIICDDYTYDDYIGNDCYYPDNAVDNDTCCEYGDCALCYKFNQPPPVDKNWWDTPEIDFSGRGLTNEMLANMVDNGEIPADVMHLNLSYNNISDLTPLSTLTNLRNLHLCNNQISCILPLAYLHNIYQLNMGNNRISDISPLTGFHFRILHLHNNLISDLSPFSEISGRKMHLGLADNRVTDLSPLAGLDLASLSLNNYTTNYNQVNDISVLAGMNNLLNFFALNNQISDISVLIELNKLNYPSINLNGNPVPPHQLEQLIASRNQHPANTPRGCFRLTFENRGITDARLVEMIDNGEIPRNIRNLTLCYNYISDLTPLTRLPYLSTLWISGNSFSDLTPLASLIHLYDLNLGNYHISDISPLVQLNLQQLQLWNTMVSDISALRGMTRLHTLTLGFNNISDLTPLAGLNNVRSLSVGFNPISCIEVVRSMSRLDSLFVGGTRVTQEQIDLLREALPGVYIWT